MKILHVGKYYPPVRGGMESIVHLLCRGQAPDHDVTALVFNTSRGTTEESLDGVRVIRVATLGKILSTEIAPSFIPWMRRLPADLVHLHTPNPVGELGTAILRRRSALVLSYHSDVVRQRGLRHVYNPIVNSVLRRADRIIVASRKYMESSETLASYHSKCVIIPFGLDLREFETTNESGARAREIRTRYGDRIVLFVGRLVYYKGVDVLLRAIQKVDARLLIAGDGPMRPELELLAGDLGLGERVTFFGEISHAEKVAMYRAATLFALPATHRSEAFGLVQVEAQTCGLPVVSTNLDSGVPYVNEHGVTGLVIPPSDADALAAALRTLLSDSALRARMAEAGRQRAEREFSLKRMLGDIQNLYEEIVRERASDREGGSSRSRKP